ncbi:hypothetical protein DMC25_00950 [Caulobacter sp. D4A]|uniref:hypothetical protein n=1 Tax=unclassified Caulobacter TaxID=2648921 RepID=UPI000D73EFD4|nr:MULTISPECIES: hypothetical protein [unclassified Caulobacter]PXA95305.1 hypothetical protein DMC25_00950 [Caulobacter sp. D4A]PXA95616.1 hypothetical protein DMC18_03590 [Caulobacter sp. D5]
MITPANLQLIEAQTSDAAVEPQVQPARVFARSIMTPAGWPWEQVRAAEIEARHATPLPLGDVVSQVRRLEAWRPSRPSRFAAFYVRRGQIGERLESDVLLSGERHRVVFVSPVQRRRRFQLLAGAGVAAALLVFGAVLAAVSAKQTGDAAEQRLAVLEAKAAADLRRAQIVRRQRKLSEAIEDRDRGPGFEAPLSDLAWCARNKRPEARVLAWHWEPGLTAVESRGQDTPFVVSDRPVQRSSAAVRRGVWLWGLGAAGQATPTAAEIRQ